METLKTTQAASDMAMCHPDDETSGWILTRTVNGREKTIFFGDYRGVIAYCQRNEIEVTTRFDDPAHVDYDIDFPDRQANWLES